MKKAEEIYLAVQQWKASGLSQTAYCEKIGIKRSTFANWVGRSKEKPASGFIAVVPPSEPVSEGMEIIYPNGVRLNTRCADPVILAELIRFYSCSA
jgi:hypothetical protein